MGKSQARPGPLRTALDQVGPLYNGTMPIRIFRQSGVVDIVEKSLNRHENHRGICGPVSRNMSVSTLNSWASNPKESATSGSMKLILFLGAGISEPSGLPLVDELTEMILRARYHYHQDRDGNFISGRNPDATSRQTDPTPVIRTLLRCISRYDKRNSKRLVYRKALTYEDLFSLCEAIQLWHLGLADNSIPTSFVESIERAARPILKGRSLKSRIRDLGSLAIEARRFIEEVVVEALQSPSVEGLGLILELAKSPTIEHLNIVTLNHDTLVEQYLRQEGIDVVDGFGPRDGDVRWYDDRVYDSDPGKVRLFKLHGSVNWCEFIGKARPAIFLGSDIGHIMDGEQRQLKRSLRSRSFLSGVNKPIAYQRGIYADAHFRFHEVLRQCTFVVMSGYSWGDTAINWRFDTWLDQDRRNSIILLHPRPKEIADGSVIVGSAYDYWIRSRHMLPVPKWLCKASMSDFEGLFCPVHTSVDRTS